MISIKQSPLLTEDFLSKIHRYSREELSAMGIDADYLHTMGNHNNPSEPEGKSHGKKSKWMLFLMLGGFVAIIIFFGNLANPQENRSFHFPVQGIGPTSVIYERNLQDYWGG